jgi:hypothetical protein
MHQRRIGRILYDNLAVFLSINWMARPYGSNTVDLKDTVGHCRTEQYSGQVFRAPPKPAKA